MGAFDFLNSTQTGTQNVTTSIDPQIKQAYLNNLNFADQVASRPYQQYGGPRIAGFNPDQEAMFSQIRGMQDSYKPLINQAQQGTNQVMGMKPNQITSGSFLSGNVNAYMNPYTSNVIDQTQQDLNRQKTLDMQQLGAQATRSGAYGGSRQAIAEQELNRNYADQFARTSGQLRSQGFDNASNLMQNDLNRNLNAQQFNESNRLNFGNQQLGAAGQLGQLGQLGQNLGFSAANALGQVGAQQQGQVQRNYDLANQDFQNQFNYPMQQLALRQGALGANIPNAGATQSTPLFENQLGKLFGIGTAANSLFKTDSNQNPIGSFLGGIGSKLLSGIGNSSGGGFLNGLFGTSYNNGGIDSGEYVGGYDVD